MSAPKRGKGSAVLARVTPQLRGAIDAEAERTGRSISQVVELWLEKGRLLAAVERKLLGEEQGDV